MTLKERVQRRVDALQISPITLARSVGLGRGYIHDVVIGRKDTFRPEKLPLVAKALRCDIEYLTGDQDEPQRPQEHPGMRVYGVCQAGVWRERTARPDYPEAVMLAPDLRYPHVNQASYILRGTNGHDPSAESIAIAVDPATYQREIRALDAGALVIAQRQQGALVELSLRRVERTPAGHELVAISDLAEPPAILLDPSFKPRGALLLGVVVSIVQQH